VETETPTVIKRGQGAMFEDLDGNIFMDWVGGIGALNVGHCQPEVIEAVKNQAELFFHTQINVLTYETYIALAEKLNTLVPIKRSESS
jgi:4-aminobutyrate aminotransferase/(S)-3-amino-2-methylpropionate transaminase